MAGDADVWDLSGWDPTNAELAGLDEKIWLSDPATDEQWLFKPVTTHGSWAQGEDWAEKLASELASLLGVPCARVELATHEGRRGSISLNLRPSGWAMHSGSDVLAGLVPGYRTKRRGRAGHTIENVAIVLDGNVPPPGSSFPRSFGAFDVFAGFLVLDAIIANQDRHDQNWSVLQSPDGRDALAGSYDHASSLGFNLRDREREKRLREGSVEAWARKGRATRFEHVPGERAATLVEHAGAALRRAGDATREFWLVKVRGIDADAVASLIGSIPDLSHLTRTFVAELITINRRRVLDDC